MVSALLIGIISFFAIWIAVHFGFRLRASRKNNTESGTAAERSDSMRDAYQIIFVLVIWSALIFLIPLLLSYNQLISHTDSRRDLIVAACKAVFLPVLFLLLIAYGNRRGFLRWIHERSWPGVKEK